KALPPTPNCPLFCLFSLLLQFLRKYLLEFLYFRPHHHLAVRLRSMQFKIIVVVIFCWIKVAKRADLGDDWIIESAAFINGSLQLLGDKLLLFIVIKYS